MSKTLTTKDGKGPKLDIPWTRTQTRIRTKFPKVELLTKLSDKDRESYSRKVKFRETIEEIEDSIEDKHGLGITKGSPDTVYEKFKQTTTHHDHTYKKTVWSDNRTRYKQDLINLVDKNNVANGYASSLTSYRATQIDSAKTLLGTLFKHGLILAERDDDEEYDERYVEDLVTCMGWMGKKLVNMTDEEERNFKKWEKAKEAGKG